MGSSSCTSLKASAAREAHLGMSLAASPSRWRYLPHVDSKPAPQNVKSRRQGPMTKPPPTAAGREGKVANSERACRFRATERASQQEGVRPLAQAFAKPQERPCEGAAPRGRWV